MHRGFCSYSTSRFLQRRPSEGVKKSSHKAAPVTGSQLNSLSTTLGGEAEHLGRAAQNFVFSSRSL